MASGFDCNPSHPHQAESKHGPNCCSHYPPKGVFIHEAHHPFLCSLYPRRWLLPISADLRPKYQTAPATFSRITFAMLPPSLHQQPIKLLAMLENILLHRTRLFMLKKTDHIPHTTPTESHITAQLTPLVMGTIQVQPPPFNQPLDFQIYAGVDEAIEVPICVFKRQRVRVGEV